MDFLSRHEDIFLFLLALYPFFTSLCPSSFINYNFSLSPSFHHTQLHPEHGKGCSDSPLQLLFSFNYKLFLLTSLSHLGGSYSHPHMFEQRMNGVPHNQISYQQNIARLLSSCFFCISYVRYMYVYTRNKNKKFN